MYDLRGYLKQNTKSHFIFDAELSLNNFFNIYNMYMFQCE